MNQAYNEDFDPNDGFDDGGGADDGLPPEGDCQVVPTADTVEIGWQNNKARCAFTVNLYRGATLIGSNTLYQGLDPAQPKALEVTESMLCALGAVDPIGDIMAAIKVGASVAQIRGIDPAKRARGRIKYEVYEGTRRMKVSIFGDAFKEKVPADARQGIAAGLAGWARQNPRGAALPTPGPRR
jgi:hypothetical protein